MKLRPFRVALGLVATLSALVCTAVPAQAAGSVSITSPAGSAKANASGSTTLTVRGTGFQSIAKAMGGIYVFFGTVDDPSGGSWKPSRGGVSGVNFRYLPDSETKDNQGRQRFVSFPGSSTEDSANGGTVAADGSWQTTLNVPGPVINVVGRSGTTEQVDCRTTTCGVITVGAHGIKNANNESFTPVSFAAAASSSGTSTSGTQAAGSSTSSGAKTAAAGTTVTGTDAAAEALPPGEVALGVDESTALIGRVMSFTARGFTPGEQVNVVLDDGLAAIGPLVVGTQGEVAGVMQLPRDLRVGTHSLQVSGAASGLIAQTTFKVSSPPGAVSATATASTTAAKSAQTPPWAWMALAVAGAAVLAVATAGILGRRAARKRAAAPRHAPDETTAQSVPEPAAPAPTMSQLTPTEIEYALAEARRQGFAEVSGR